MKTDSAILVGSFVAALTIGLALIFSGIEKMVQVENNIIAISRIYKPGGCEYLGELTQKFGFYVFDCGGELEIVEYRLHQ